MRRLVSLFVTLCLLVSFISFSSINASAKESTFYPFRSYYMRYLSFHASEESEIVKDIWKKLFYEETHWKKGESFYDANYKKWSDKYFDNYVNLDGKIVSSKGVVASENSDMSGYFALTLRHNPEFFEELLKDDAHGMKSIVSNYLKNAPEKYPYIEDYFVEKTADGTYIGTKKGASNNILEKYGVDLDMLRIFADRWSDLSQKQIDWAISYMSMIYDDYVAHHDDGKSMAKKVVCKKKVGDKEVDFRPLYDLMARSAVGAKSNKYQQEFFDYVVGNPQNVNDLPHGLGDWLSKAFDIKDSRILSINSIYDIFSDEAHCIPGCSKCGKAASYNNALAYNITFSSQAPYAQIRALVSKNEYANSAMIAWKEHYEYIHMTSGNSLTTSYEIGWSDKDKDYDGWHGQGYHVSASASVSGKVDLSGKLTSNTTKIEVIVQGGSSTATLYSAGGKALKTSSLNGCDWNRDAQDTITLNLNGLTDAELKGAYLYISVSSHDSGVVDNDSCTGASAYANVFSISLYRKIAQCYATQPPRHKYITQYVWNADYSQCVGYATCTEDRNHTTIAYSQKVNHTEDSKFDYYTPVFAASSQVEAKTKAVPKNRMTSATQKLDISNSKVLSGETYMRDDSKTVYFQGEGVSTSSRASATFSILKGAIPENATSLTFNMHAGEVSIMLYLDGEVIYETCYGDEFFETDKSVEIDLSRYSNKQISRMYVVGTMYSHEHVTWSYDYEHHSVSIVQLNSVVAGY